jgi:hypothetical protein
VRFETIDRNISGKLVYKHYWREIQTTFNHLLEVGRLKSLQFHPCHVNIHVIRALGYGASPDSASVLAHIQAVFDFATKTLFTTSSQNLSFLTSKQPQTLQSSLLTHTSKVIKMRAKWRKKRVRRLKRKRRKTRARS